VGRQAHHRESAGAIISTQKSDIVFGIYGFSFSRRATVIDADLVPLYASPESQKRATDRKTLDLTGYGVFPSGRQFQWQDQAAFVRRLADGMTFCQQQMVLASRLISLSAGDTADAMIASGRLPRSLPILADRHTAGQLIGEDAFWATSRTAFLETFLAHVRQAPATDPLTAAFYRQIEVWKLFHPHVELEHYLFFSGLEILGRAFGPQPNHRNAAVPIAGFLRAHGFAVTQALVEDWAAARNAVFHRGLLETTRGAKNIRLVDHLYQLGTLLGDAALKQLGFDDGHLNWSRWKDRIPFL
jgi:hypothetical protein